MWTFVVPSQDICKVCYALLRYSVCAEVTDGLVVRAGVSVT